MILKKLKKPEHEKDVRHFKGKCEKHVEKFIEDVAAKMPEFIYGSNEERKKMLYRIHGANYDVDFVKRHRYDMTKKYITVIFATMLLLGLYILSSITGESIIKQGGGEFYIDRPQGNAPVRVELIAEGKVGNKNVAEEVSISVKEKNGEMEKSEGGKENDGKKSKAGEDISKEFKKYSYEVSNSTTGRKLVLASQIGEVKSIVWREKPKNTAWIIVILSIGLLGLVYVSQNERLKKELKSCTESIDEELPGFLNKLIILMNSGMVFSSAFQRIMAEEKARRKGNEGSEYFYRELEKIEMAVLQTKASTAAELKRFAERSENREWMRVINVISNNIERGTELVRILESEAGLLWFKRKKRAEEKAKIAETKLSLPLAIQLLALITITLAPAMMDML